MTLATKIKYIPMGCLLATLMLGGCNPAETRETETSGTATGNTAGTDGLVQIFDGQTLSNWEADTTYWRVENGILVGEITPETRLERNTFAIWRGGEPADFELTLQYRISADGNSGINYRSERVEDVPFALKGYQADIDGKNRYTGQNYEERMRTTLAYRGQIVLVNSPEKPDMPIRENVQRNAWQSTQVTGSLGESDSLRTHIKENDWNECRLVVQGNRLQHYVNGILMSDVTDNDSVNRKMAGLLGVQVHVGPPMKVEFRNIRMKEL
jgi:hypothetical protein